MKIPENVLLMLKDKANVIGNGACASFLCDIEEKLDLLEELDSPMVSPIEQMFFIEWNFRQRGVDRYAPEEWLELIPQYHGDDTGKYRIDFSVDFVSPIVNCSIYSIFCGHESRIFSKHPAPMLGVEVDGHSWHEKTKEQVRRDKERERFLVSKGWKILRFAGSEVFKDPSACVDEAIECAASLARPYFKTVREYIIKGKA